MALHLGQRAFLPAFSEATASTVWQDEQVARIFMEGLLQNNSGLIADRAQQDADVPPAQLESRYRMQANHSKSYIFQRAYEDEHSIRIVTGGNAI